MLDLSMTVFIAFIAFIVVFFYIDRKNIDREGISILRRTTKGKAFLTWLGQRFPRLWWVYGTLAVVIGFYYSIYFTGMIFSVILDSFLSETVPAVGGLLLPVPTEDAVSLPGVIGIPIIHWIITIFLLILIHEGSHAVMAVREGVRIKSMGWGLFAALPVAFVEPDEEQLNKKKPMKQLRVYAAGSMGNFVLAFSFFLLLALTTPNFYEVSPGVKFSGYMEGFPAEEAGLTGVITRIDGVAIDNAQNLSDYLHEAGPGKSITITTIVLGSEGYETKPFSLVTAEHPDGGDGGFIGITNIYSNTKVKDGVDPGVAKFLFGKDPFGTNLKFFGLLFWIAIINFAIGLMNLLPAFPLDGGRIWKILLDKFVPRYSMIIMKASTIFVWVMVAVLFGIGIFGGSTLF